MAGFENTSLHSALNHQFYRYLVGQSCIGLWVGRVGGKIKSKAPSNAVPLAPHIFRGGFSCLEPTYIIIWLPHVVTIPTRTQHKCYCVRAITNFLNVGPDVLNSVLSSLLSVGWLGGG